MSVFDNEYISNIFVKKYKIPTVEEFAQIISINQRKMKLPINQTKQFITFQNGSTYVHLGDNFFEISNYDPQLDFIPEHKFGTRYFALNNYEEILDFICGNTWPDYLEEFLSLVIERIKPL